MRMSCNGCRVLRKGCSRDCSIRPCLHWIASPESQSNATLFLAKFYGRAGLLNLLNSAADHLRPAIFRSLLYEACGRIVNPVYGSVGLLWTGRWQLCQAAVEAVLKGKPIAIAPLESEAADDGQSPPFKACDIRHVARDKDSTGSKPRRRRFKSLGSAPAQAKPEGGFGSASDSEPDAGCCTEELKASHEPASSEEPNLDSESKEGESESVLSTETAAAEEATAELGSWAQNLKRPNCEIGLELTLGFGSVSRADHVIPVKKRRFDLGEFGSDMAHLGVD